MSEKFYKLIYVSSSRFMLEEGELEDILKTSRKNNNALNITGLLLYHEGNFIQILEGDKEKVEALYNKILYDPRHVGVIRLLEEYADERDFPEWSMGFKRLDSNSEPGTLDGFNELIENASHWNDKVGETSSKVQVFINTFKTISGIEK